MALISVKVVTLILTLILILILTLSLTLTLILTLPLDIRILVVTIGDCFSALVPALTIFFGVFFLWGVTGVQVRLSPGGSQEGAALAFL